ncbi:APC family permease [Streptacidiphilus jiangxiensis]|uniref:Amino acid transporter n=1 Tax=Streptacidiphilus jiangxiensis TaxID=235985 RepID=A0A1H7YX67_STRJI|nr:APC family permease [Streptacidiphilus jiangxiensis]SEM50565.1 Amino acid transporter [Streptacidiphilus jiangxiensis]
MQDTTTAGSDRTMSRSIGTRDSLAVAASSIAATSSVGVGIGLIAGVVGLHLPGLMLLGFLPVLGIAVGYAQLNRVEPNCGNAYVWVGQSLSPWLGFLVGWINIVGTIVFLAYTTTLTGSALLQLGGEGGLHHLAGLALDPNSSGQSTAIGMVVLAAVTVTAMTGVAKATRFQTILLVFEYLVLLGFCGYGLFAGHQPFHLSWFDPFGAPSAGALAQGLVLALFCYWGFDSAFSVSEEVGDPRQASRGGILSLVLVLGIFLLAGLSFQRVLPLDDLAGNGATGLMFFGDRLARQPLAALPLVALTFSLVSSLQASVIPTARGLFAMGRDGTMGQVWTRLHPRFGTPARGTALIGLTGAAVAAVSLVLPTVNQLIGAAVNAIGVVVALGYALTAIACAWRFRSHLRTAPRRALLSVVVPLVSALALLFVGGTLCWTLATSTDHFALDANNGWFELLTPALIIVTGLVAAAWAKWGRRSAYFTTGRGTDADSLPALDADAGTTATAGATTSLEGISA